MAVSAPYATAPALQWWWLLVGVTSSAVVFALIMICLWRWFRVPSVATVRVARKPLLVAAVSSSPAVAALHVASAGSPRVALNAVGPMVTNDEPAPPMAAWREGSGDSV
eukprot:TRINITY_DN96_c0_g1_i1.p1 TRINITY_DN96_c0_g1~~TRINITY_DN96_c0_g1_i1.p1  ORF type:complete len:109 (-),score=24.68 TRINITY_DN96_c0_g1_i1:64-390(-)